MPSFSSTPARITDPAVGASVWASGSHVCIGNSGTLTASATANARKIQRAADQSKGLALDESSTTVRPSAISTTSKLSGRPACRSSISAIWASLGAPPDSSTIASAAARSWSWRASRCR